MLLLLSGETLLESIQGAKDGFSLETSCGESLLWNLWPFDQRETTFFCGTVLAKKKIVGFFLHEDCLRAVLVMIMVARDSTCRTRLRMVGSSAESLWLNF